MIVLDNFINITTLYKRDLKLRYLFSLCAISGRESKPVDGIGLRVCFGHDFAWLVRQAESHRFGCPLRLSSLSWHLINPPQFDCRSG